jgi:hypothetical protein
VRQVRIEVEELSQDPRSRRRIIPISSHRVLRIRFGETSADRHRFLSWRQSSLRASCGRQLNGQSVQRRGEIRQLLGVGVGQTAANGHCPLGGLEPTASQVTFLQSAPPM